MQRDSQICFYPDQQLRRNLGYPTPFSEQDNLRWRRIQPQFRSLGQCADGRQGTTISGDFAGTRISGDLNADFRFAGTHQDPVANRDAGVDAIGIHGTDAAGIAHSVVTGATQRITGTISNWTDLDATTGDGTTITGSLDAPMDSLTGATQLNGIWNDGTDDGTFSGDGCHLN